MTANTILSGPEVKKLYPEFLGGKLPGVIRGIYNRQGFYSALNFIIKAGIVVGSSQEEAEKCLRGYIHG